MVTVTEFSRRSLFTNAMSSNRNGELADVGEGPLETIGFVLVDPLSLQRGLHMEAKLRSIFPYSHGHLQSPTTVNASALNIKERDM